jgi:predicted aconitase/predicted aconitase with swiveling domain
MRIEAYAGRSVVPGAADGELLHADVGLSFMGGVDSSTGRVIDTHHPLHGQSVDGKVLALPSGRGSCSGSATLFELLLSGHAPAALIFRADEPILTLGVILAAEMFGVSIPVVRLRPADFAQLRSASRVSVRGGRVTVTDTAGPPAAPTPLPDLDPISGAPATGIERGAWGVVPPHDTDFRLTEHDHQLLSGAFGEAARLAIRVVIRAAQLEGANDLIDIDGGHIDGCFYQGPASLRFAERLVELGGQVAVPTSMNSLCIDRRRWRDQGVPAELGEPSEALADAYLRLGVTPTYTCAPYLLDDPPARGQQIAWAESNAVVFANAVIGARTMKYPDYLDILIALIGRAPNAGAHTDAGRRATLQIAVDVPVEQLDDAFYPTLGYHVGTIASNDVPALTGLELTAPTADDLRAFGAAFATTSAAATFHIVGVTPEAPTLDAVTDPAEPIQRVRVGATELARTWEELNSATVTRTDMVALGNPHFSLTEFARLADLCDGRTKSPDVELVVTTSRSIHAKAERAGLVARLEQFGARLVNDTCWCLIGEPVVTPSSRTITTSSAKYAHYGTAAVGRGFHLRSLAGCVDAACTGDAGTALPAWLGSPHYRAR